MLSPFCSRSLFLYTRFTVANKEKLKQKLANTLHLTLRNGISEFRAIFSVYEIWFRFLVFFFAIVFFLFFLGSACYL